MTTIRGAITIENNDAEEIVSATQALLTQIFEKNNLQAENIIFMIFTATRDIDQAYPAVAARKMGITEASLMCMQEMYVDGSLPMCIRVMVGVGGLNAQSDAVHCYMKNADVLRPDLKYCAVAIDGPVASGKSSIAREVARLLGYTHIDTGALYRAVGLYFIRKGVWDREGIINGLDDFLLTVEFTEEGFQRTFLDGEDVSEEIRSARAAEMSSFVAGIDEVREKLLPLQRSLAENRNVIMDGRDIQTVVLPDAAVKIFVTASVDERTKRRCVDLEKKGEENNFESVKRKIIERDNNDSSRANAPLRKAETAHELDTTEMNLAESVERVLDIVRQTNF